jgi:hypothetical protein
MHKGVNKEHNLLENGRHYNVLALFVGIGGGILGSLLFESMKENKQLKIDLPPAQSRI